MRADPAHPVHYALVPGGADRQLHDRLLHEFGIEVPVFYWPAPPQMILRISAQAYNDCTQYERLAECFGTVASEQPRFLVELSIALPNLLTPSGHTL